ncbi:MAG: hypothetical protein AAF585_01845, partial [Verrucomicrobiota bacterium]
TAIALACLVVIVGSTDIFTVGKKLTSAFGGPLLAIFLLAFFHKRASAAAVAIGSILGAAITLGLMLKFPNWFSVWYWPIGTSLALGISIPLSYLSKPIDDPLTYWRVLKK